MAHLNDLYNSVAPMRINPDPIEAYLTGESSEVPSLKLVTMFGAELLRPLFVIVEAREGRGLSMSQKREYLRRFSDAERKLLSRWYLKIYAWYLRTGIPVNGVRMTVGTYQTLRRFADFHAGY